MSATFKSREGWALGIACMVASSVTAAQADLRVVEAAKRQDVAAVRGLLQKGVKANEPQPDGTTALHWAAYWGNADMATLLIRAGSNVNAATDLGVTPLLVACEAGEAAIVQTLLRAKADANTALPTGQTALMTCARTGSVVAVKALLANGANPDAAERSEGQTALMWAAGAKQSQIVETLVEAGAVVDAHTRVAPWEIYTGIRASAAPPRDEKVNRYKVQRGGYTALLFAAQQGDRASATVLLDAGAQVNYATPIGTTPLIIAAHSGHGDMGELLLARGADPRIDAAGYTALHVAVLRGLPQLIKALIARGADVNARITKGTPVRKTSQDYALAAAWIGATPYWLAARFAETDIMRVLAAAGADATLALKDGTTSLHVAIAAMVNPLGSTDRRDRYQAPPDVAAWIPGDDERATIETLKLTLEHHAADVNDRDFRGNTPLHLAAGRGANGVIEFLVAHGATLDVRNKDGETPLSLTHRPAPAAGGGDAVVLESTQELLRKLGATDEGIPASKRTAER
jgi:ankyrin repeat protein